MTLLILVLRAYGSRLNVIVFSTPYMYIITIINCSKTIFMARRAIPMIAFPRVRCMFIYIILCLCHLREYALYT